MKHLVHTTVILAVGIVIGVGAVCGHSVLSRRAERNLLIARSTGEWIAFALARYAHEHEDHLPPYDGWEEAIKQHLPLPPTISKRRQQLIDALPYYEYSKEVAGKDCSNMLSGETIVLTRTRGLPRGVKIEVYLDGLGRTTRPPPPFWRRWFQRSTCPYQ